MLSGLALFTGGTQAPFPDIALAVNALADGLTCILLLRLGARFSSPRAGLGAALVWAIAPFSVTFAIGGLETSVYVMLLITTISAYLENRLILTALTAALAMLTRPDALILLGPLALDIVLQATGWGKFIKLPLHTEKAVQKPSYWTTALVFAIPLVAWIAFSTLYFGSTLPHSMAAKAVAYYLPADSAFIRLLQHYSIPFMGNQTFGAWWIGVGMLLCPFLFIIGGLQVLKSEPHAWPFLVYPWLYFAVFAIANPLIFRWYLTPPLPFYMLTILVGADRLLTAIFSPESAGDISLASPRRRWMQHLTAITAVILLPLALISQDWVARPDHGLSRPAPGMAWYQLELLYRQAADSLAPELGALDSPATLAAGDVGVLGFYTPTRILDTVGLNSPQSTRYYPLDERYYAINYAIPPDLILDQHPDYIVILEVYGRNGLLPDARFQQAYELIEKIPTDIYGSEGMLIFKKKPGS